MPPILPALFDVFVAEVVPLLQQRGLFRIAYDGDTLRDHVGLARPANRYFDAGADAWPPSHSRPWPRPCPDGPGAAPGGYPRR